MAPLANLNTSVSQSARASAPPSSFRMPHVFVIPPEEEQQDNPPWCCFDADEQPENSGDLPSNLDIHFRQSENDVPIPFTRHAPVHQRWPRAPSLKKLEKKQRPEAIQIIETKSSRAGQRDVREDSDVIEVVKVKRGREALTDLEENTKTKRSKTLKARATKALQSIKNVSKTSHRTHVKDLWTSTGNMQEQICPQQDRSQDRLPHTPSHKGSHSRANSRSLSHIFQPMKSSRSELSFTVSAPPAVAPPGTHHTISTTNSLSYFWHNNTNSSSNNVPSTLATDDTQNRAVSSMRSTKNISTKFSVRELHRLFSLSSTPDDSSPSHTAAAAPFSSAGSSSKLSTSTLPQDHLDVPMEEDIFADAYFVDLGTPDRKLASRYHHGFHTYHNDDWPTPYRPNDPSFEMKLDSLHFDALSFNAEDFHTSREGSVPR